MEIPNIQKFVCYFRVSTDKQNLGLEAQKTVTDKYCQNGNTIAEFTEKESGKNDDRIELDKALRLCKQQNAILVIAKLDRLSRNLTFISSLMDSKTDFVACDMPTANELTIGIFAAIAQNERKTISQRTKAALAELKRKGIKLGKPQNFTNEGRLKGSQKRSKKAKECPKNKQIQNLVGIYLKEGYSMRQIAEKFNELGMRTKNDKLFTFSSVRMYKDRINMIELYREVN
jgi:DNA invertase Pin-like site-specific DNA recombinase